MKLYGSYTSPYVRHCRVVLLETDLLCSFIETDHSASAQGSPTKRVPYLHDGPLALTDSAAIIKHLRNRAGQTFLPDVADYNRFCMINTALDTTVNLFLLEKEGITPESSAYLARQSQRVASILAQLEKLSLPEQPPFSDVELRLACYLAWGLFRKRFSLENHPNLTRFLDAANRYEPFAVTAPPQ